jgi:ribosomal protein S27AE
MQHIPHYNLDDIERGRQEMQAFRRERSYPDIALTGEEIHRAFCKVDPDNPISWDEVPVLVQVKYNELAEELNRELNARLAWFEGEDRVTIQAARCPTCGEMLEAEHAEGHACWQKGGK